jgi:hypothetical protein
MEMEENGQPRSGVVKMLVGGPKDTMESGRWAGIHHNISALQSKNTAIPDL